MNILITGAAGFIGTNFVYYILEKCPGINIIAYDKLTYAGNLENLTRAKENYSDRFTFIKGDINDEKHLKAVFAVYNIEQVINFAAESHVDRSIHDPQTFLKTNVNGVQTLLDVCRWKWKNRTEARFIQVSTDEVYGSLSYSGDYFFEEDPLDPSSPYSASKAAADLLCQAYYVDRRF